MRGSFLLASALFACTKEDPAQTAEASARTQEVLWAHSFEGIQGRYRSTVRVSVGGEESVRRTQFRVRDNTVHGQLELLVRDESSTAETSALLLGSAMAPIGPHEWEPSPTTTLEHPERYGDEIEFLFPPFTGTDLHVGDVRSSRTDVPLESVLRRPICSQLSFEIINFEPCPGQPKRHCISYRVKSGPCFPDDTHEVVGDGHFSAAGKVVRAHAVLRGMFSIDGAAPEAVEAEWHWIAESGISLDSGAD